LKKTAIFDIILHNMIAAEYRDRTHGFVPIEDSVSHFKTKWVFDPSLPQISVVSDFRIATRIAIAKEDDALDKRWGGLGMIFYHDWAENTPLDMARAGAAVFFEAYSKYCTINRLISDAEASEGQQTR
jgi:hypothetical protein